MKAEEIIQKSTGLKPSDSQFGPIQEVLEISEAIKENEDKINKLCGVNFQDSNVSYDQI